MPVTDVSPPGSESMSPPTPHAMSPVIPSQSARNYFGAADSRIQTPVAIVTGRSPLNGTQVDTRRWLFDIFVLSVKFLFFFNKQRLYNY